MSELQPWVLDPQEVVIFENMLQERKPATVFEWGAGGSTVYYPALMPWLEKWTAVEHDHEWYEVVKANRGERVLLVEIPPVEGWTNQEEWDDTFEQFADYVLYPLLAGGKYDLVYVDGRARNCCLALARYILNPGGLVVLHDSDVQHPVGECIYASGKAFWRTVHKEMTYEFMEAK